MSTLSDQGPRVFTSDPTSRHSHRSCNFTGPYGDTAGPSFHPTGCHSNTGLLRYLTTIVDYVMLTHGGAYDDRHHSWISSVDRCFGETVVDLLAEFITVDVFFVVGTSRSCTPMIGHRSFLAVGLPTFVDPTDSLVPLCFTTDISPVTHTNMLTSVHGACARGYVFRLAYVQIPRLPDVLTYSPDRRRTVLARLDTVDRTRVTTHLSLLLSSSVRYVHLVSSSSVRSLDAGLGLYPLVDLRLPEATTGTMVPPPPGRFTENQLLDDTKSFTPGFPSCKPTTTGTALALRLREPYPSSPDTTRPSRSARPLGHPVVLLATYSKVFSRRNGLRQMLRILLSIGV